MSRLQFPRTAYCRPHLRSSASSSGCHHRHPPASSPLREKEQGCPTIAVRQPKPESSKAQSERVKAAAYASLARSSASESTEPSVVPERIGASIIDPIIVPNTPTALSVAEALLRDHPHHTLSKIALQGG